MYKGKNKDLLQHFYKNKVKLTSGYLNAAPPPKPYSFIVTNYELNTKYTFFHNAHFFSTYEFF